MVRAACCHPIISIIVPVYNVELYLSECLDSILAQSFRDWEMLLVDDGSTDESGRICDDYAAADTRIRVFHQNNQGLSAARNKGLDHVKGAYITMVDSDDVLLSADYLSILYDVLLSYNAQISLVDFHPFSGKPPTPPITRPHSVHCYNGLDAYAYHWGDHGFNYGHSGGKLYDRTLFSEVRYPVGRLSEDAAIAHLLFSPCERVAVVYERLYGYRVRTDGIMGASDKRSLIHDTVSAYCGRIDYFNQLGRPDLGRLAEQQLLCVIGKLRRKVATEP